MRSLCAIFAHPDDETFSSGGTLARYSDEGVETILITATSGEAGDMPPGLAEGRDETAVWRERELRQAAAALGVRQLRLLHFPDSDLRNRASELTLAVREVLAELRPQVVITENAQGITGHPDHMAVTQAAVRAFDSLPDAGILKLYEHALPLSMAAEGRIGTPEDFITTRVNVEPWRERIIAAFRAHGSQVDAATLDRFSRFAAPWINHYVCVRSRVPVLIPEDDLFQGVDAADTVAGTD